MTKRTKKEARAMMEALGCEAGHEHLDRDLEGVFGNYLLDDGARWRAFIAVGLIVSATMSKYGKDGEEFDGLRPTSFVQIPWWAARALTCGWMEWWEGEKKRDPKATLGRAFKVEATKPGRQGSPFTQAGREVRNREIAFMIARHLPGKIEAVIFVVAKEAGLNERSVRTIYSKYKKQINALSRRLKQIPEFNSGDFSRAPK